MDSKDFSTLFEFVKLCLKFVWLCLNYAAMHQFCACFVDPLSEAFLSNNGLPLKFIKLFKKCCGVDGGEL